MSKKATTWRQAQKQARRKEDWCLAGSNNKDITVVRGDGDEFVKWKKGFVAFVKAHSPCRIFIKSDFLNVNREDFDSGLALADALGTEILEIDADAFAKMRAEIEAKVGIVPTPNESCHQHEGLDGARQTAILEEARKKDAEIDREWKKEAERAVDFLEHVRVEDGCETALRLIVEAAYLTSAMHQALHGKQGQGDPNETDLRNLEASLLKVVKAAPLDASWQFVSLWNAVMSFRLMLDGKSRVLKMENQPPVDKKVQALEEREEAHGLLVIDKKLTPDPQLVAAVQQKYPAAEPSRQRMYAQFLTRLKRETKTESFNELEQMIPQSYVDNLLARIA
jgi:hypothetical protein